MGMKTKMWGPAMWVTLHVIAANYPNNPTQEQKNNYKAFFISLGNILPCGYCRESYKFFSKLIPIDNYLVNSHYMQYWVYLIHNLVNQKLGVPQNSWPPFREVIAKYQKYQAR